MNPRFWKLLWIAPAALLAMALFLTLGTYVVMRLWNWLTPVMFGWQAITFWQALGLLVLSRLLFGGMGLRGNGGSGFGRRMRDRWVRMDPEERERFRRSMFERYGAGPSPGEPTGE